MPSDSDIVDMLDSTNYAGDTSNLGKLVRKNIRKEWSYFFDVIIKVFSGKISNYDAITTAMQPMAYNILYNKFFDLGSIILNKITIKLGKLENRPKNIYFSRLLGPGTFVEGGVEYKQHCRSGSSDFKSNILSIKNY